MTMNKQDLQRAFGKHGEFLSVTQIANIIGIDRGTARAILKGVPYQPFGKKKLYAVADVAEVLYRRQI